MCIYYIYILYIYFFPSCFYLIIVTNRNSYPIVVNMFEVNDKEARTS